MESLGSGKMTKRWQVSCHRCGDWDLSSGTHKTAAETFQEGGWVKLGSFWICKICITKADISVTQDNRRQAEKASV